MARSFTSIPRARGAPRAAAISAKVPAPVPTSSSERGAAGNSRTRSSVVRPGPIAASAPERYGSETMKSPSSGVTRTADAISPPCSRTTPAPSSAERRGAVSASSASRRDSGERYSNSRASRDPAPAFRRSQRCTSGRRIASSCAGAIDSASPSSAGPYPVATSRARNPLHASSESWTRGSIGASTSVGVPSSTRLVYWVDWGLERHVHLLALQARHLDRRTVLPVLRRSGPAGQRRARGSVRRADRRAEVLRPPDAGPRRHGAGLQGHAPDARSTGGPQDAEPGALDRPLDHPAVSP